MKHLLTALFICCSLFSMGQSRLVKKWNKRFEDMLQEIIASLNRIVDELKIQSEVPIAIGIRIGTARISIYNLVGQLAVQLQTVNFKLQTPIDVSELPPGLYYLELKSDQQFFRSKFVKQ